ncbi:polysaccharide biosynthesis/export family protein [Chelatococcus sp. SYSU_G07232]|uniref:Polysaccharide biosynthesis/export family protein n=1 Tax=Chelatococcus albus TaxID=3047466 RepID=A0ABT7AC20_9HYPH|nr:polysaccharide biosynthesis/export family protein [Chelatococcus sp. SYSU_G07232]MDJ1156914.1 polysaccharide biosynthesis/export family protein [Chelatococcus sp. SYSU_G07232]
MLMLQRQLAALLMMLAAAGCATAPPPVTAIPGPPPATYTLASGDKLRIIVFGQDNLSNIYAVDASGRITMPLIGSIPAHGQSTQQLARAIEARLRAGYVREPKVTVEVDTYRPFFILGEVTNAGQFPFVSGMTVQTAVAIAGGFSPRAVQSSAEVTRQVDGRILVATVPITYPLRPGDTVVIKERWF